MRHSPLSILIILVIGTGLTYLFWDLLWLGGGLIGGDMYSYYLPQKMTYQAALERGDWALWNDLVSLGYPQHAESQTGAFYPFHWLLYSTLSLNDAYHINQLLHYIIAFAGICLLAQTLGLSLRASILAGLVYVYGWFPVRICLEWAIIGGAWMPWALWCVERFLTTRWWRYLMGLTFVITLQLLPGHFLIAFLTILTVVAYAGARVWWMTSSDRKEPPQGLLRQNLPLLTAVGASVVCAFLLAAIQLVPTWQLKQDSQREQAVHDVGYGHLPPAYLAQVVMPWKWYWQPANERDAQLQQLNRLAINSATNQAEAHLYFGLVPLAFALLGLIPTTRPRGFSVRQRAFLWGLAILALTYAFGWWLPLTRHLPGFSFFIGPGRYGLITTLAIALLAAESVDLWLAKIHSGTRTLVWGIILLVTVADLFVVSRLVFYAVPLQYPPILYRDQSPINQFLASAETETGQPVRLYAPGANLPTLLGFSSVPEYLGIGPAEYYDPKLKVPPPPELVEGSVVLPFDREFVTWLQNAGVTHLLTEHPLSRDWPAELVLKIADPFLNSCWARPPQAVHYISQLQETRGRWFWESGNTKTAVRLETNLPHRKEYSVDLEKPDRLVITELLTPGWHVRIDDQSAQPMKIEQLFRGVDVPAGEHRIVWSYEPASFRWGIGISLLTLLVLAGLAHIRFWHPQRLSWLDARSETDGGRADDE